MPLVNLPPLHQGRDGTTQVFKLINEMRGGLNMLPDVFYVPQFSTPGDGALAVLWGSQVANNSGAKLTASVFGLRDDLTQGAAFTLECAIINLNGTVTFVGGSFVTTFSREDAAGTDAQFVISGTTIGLEVRDAGVQQTFWTARIYAETLGS